MQLSSADEKQWMFKQMTKAKNRKSFETRAGDWHGKAFPPYTPAFRVGNETISNKSDPIQANRES